MGLARLGVRRPSLVLAHEHPLHFLLFPPPCPNCCTLWYPGALTCSQGFTL